jgi:hypothetical protein
MMCILVGLLLIIVLFIISKHLRGEYVNILVDHPRGMEEVDERFLMLIQSLREVGQGVGQDTLPCRLEVRVFLSLELEGG